MLHFRWLGVGITLFVLCLIFFNGLRKRHQLKYHFPPSDGFDESQEMIADDGIVTIRKFEPDMSTTQQPIKTTAHHAYHHTDDVYPPHDNIHQESVHSVRVELENTNHTDIATADTEKPSDPSLVVLYVMAKSGYEFAGYELLQVLLSSGMRYGDMDIFHRHQDISGKGPVLFSLASATKPGTFDIQKIGSMFCHGLCLFMRLQSVEVDKERFDLMLITAERLADELNGVVCNVRRVPINEEAIHRIQKQIEIYADAECEAEQCKVKQEEALEKEMVD